LATRWFFFLLPEVRQKGALESELAQMAQARDQLVKMRTMLKNQLHGLFVSYGVALPKKALASRRQRTALRGRSLSPLADVQRRVLLGQIEALDAGIAELEQVLTEYYTLKNHWTFRDFTNFELAR